VTYSLVEHSRRLSPFSCILCYHLIFFVLWCLWLSLDGVPACANKRLLRQILRDEWNFTGYVVSDDDALEFMITHHHYLDNTAAAAAAAVKAGCNLELTDMTSGLVFRSIPQVCVKYLQCLEWVDGIS